MNDAPDFSVGDIAPRGANQGSGEDGGRSEPPEFVLIEWEPSTEDKSVETGGRAGGWSERLRVAEGETKRHWTSFLAQQRRLITD
jgi:hypothetical protein